jgi:hypothetical protein
VYGSKVPSAGYVDRNVNVSLMEGTAKADRIDREKWRL